jgi:hypothetical protein
MHETVRDCPSTREARPTVSDLDADLKPVNHREKLDCIKYAHRYELKGMFASPTPQPTYTSVSEEV